MPAGDGLGAALNLGGGEWADCLVPAVSVPGALSTSIRRRMGAVPGWLSRLAPCPWLVDAMVEMIGRPVTEVPPDLFDLVSLVVSQDNSCRYCYGVQRAVLRIHGYTDPQIDRLVRDAHVGELTATERAAVDFARRLSRGDPRPGRDEIARLAEAGLGGLATVETAFVAAWGNFTNRVATLLALPAEPLEQFVQNPIFRFVRPLVAWRMRRRPRGREPLPEPNTGPYAQVIAALEGSPAAGALRRAVDGAWGSSILPRRTKALMLAVVARALGCRTGEAEARRFLDGEGFERSDVDRVLDTLSSPSLDPREARLVPFARETVRYQPASIQARVAEVSRGFRPEETIETVGIAALANTLCRLSVVLDAC